EPPARPRSRGSILRRKVDYRVEPWSDAGGRPHREAVVHNPEKKHRKEHRPLSDRKRTPRSLVLTSESVTEGHPDKIADQISDRVLDAVLAEDPTGRVACETLITTGLVVVAGEISTSTYIDVPRLVRERVTDIGYTRAKY